MSSTWTPSKRMGIVSGLAAGATIVAIDWILYLNLKQSPLDAGAFIMGMFLLAGLAAFFAWSWHFYRLLSMRYLLDRNTLTLSLGWTRHVIPLDQIEYIMPPDERLEPNSFRGVLWPGYICGSIDLSKGDQATVVATEPFFRQLIVVTPDKSYTISPRDTEAFLATLAVEQRLGPIHPAKQVTLHRGIAAWPIWQNQPLWLAMILAIIVNMALWAYLAFHFPDLPNRIALHFDASGQPDRIAGKTRIFVLSIIGAASIAVNGPLAILLHRIERILSYFLVGNALLIQIVLWLVLKASLGL